MTKRIKVGLGLGFIAIVGIMFSIFLQDGTVLFPNGPLTSDDGNVHASLSAEYNDDRALVGYAQNVFVGKVLAQVGSEPRNGMAHTQFEVEVVYNVKGKLTGSVLVDQATALTKKPDVLRPEGLYVMAARYIPAVSRFYHVGSQSSFVSLIGSTASLSREDLVEAAVDNSRVQDLLRAYPEEIVRPADIANGYAMNSFTSLTAAEQREILDRIENF